MNSRSSKSDSQAELPEFVLVGRILKPHGVRGEVTVSALSDVNDRFSVGSEVDLVLANGDRRKAGIASVRGRKEKAIVHFSGVETREQADELRGAVVEVDRSMVPPPPHGSFYFFELVGCDCVDHKVGELGRVATIVEDGGGLLLEIVGDSRTLLVPFVEAYLKDVDTACRRIELELPAGLIETCTSKS